MFIRFIFTLFLVLFSFTKAEACTGDSCANGLVYSAFGKGKTLVIFLHGDVSSGGAADYMNAHAKSFAASRPHVTAVALLRPGYYDKAGNTSDGSDNGRRDGYSAGNINAVSGAISALKAKFRTTKTIGLGHSGGAAILGVIAGKSSQLQGVVLVSCPCDIAKWRVARGRGQWSSQSPIDYASGASLPIVLVTGSADDNTSPDLAKDYAAKANHATVRIVNGAGHNFGGGLAGAAVNALSGMVR